MLLTVYKKKNATFKNFSFKDIISVNVFTKSFSVLFFFADGRGVIRGQRQSRASEDDEVNGTEASIDETSSSPRILALTLRTVTKDVGYAGKCMIIQS